MEEIADGEERNAGKWLCRGNRDFTEGSLRPDMIPSAHRGGLGGITQLYETSEQGSLAAKCASRGYRLSRVHS